MRSNKNNRYRVIFSDEVRDALVRGTPVIALESAFFIHRIPYPQNVRTALTCGRIAKQHGAVTAICAVVEGKLCAGLTEQQLDELARQGQNVALADCGALPILIAKKQDGAVTAAAAMLIASIAGIKLLASAGIEGIQRGADAAISTSDLTALCSTSVSVVCTGLEGASDTARTIEYLKTWGVPTVGYRTNGIPEFCTRAISYNTEFHADSVAELAAMINAAADLRTGSGILIVNPVPNDFAMDPEAMNNVAERALREAQNRSVPNSELAACVTEHVDVLTSGESLKACVAALYNNVRLAAQTVSSHSDI